MQLLSSRADDSAFISIVMAPHDVLLLAIGIVQNATMDLLGAGLLGVDYGVELDVLKGIMVA